jgi:hypothetical protein
MRLPHIFFAACLTAIVALTGTPRAQAQGYAHTLENVISRPSENSPSRSVGGRYTNNLNVRTLESTRADNSLLGQSQFAFHSRTMNGSRGVHALSPTRVGLHSNFTQPGGQTYFGSGLGSNDSAISEMSGLGRATSLNLPLPGLSANELPGLTSYLYTPKPEPSRFDDLLGLVPSQAPPSGPTAPTMVAGLQAQTEDRAAQALQVGIALFRQGTVEMRDVNTGSYAQCADCEQNLKSAFQRFRMSRDLDPHSALPLVLMAHAALEQDQPREAISYLMQAVIRQPGFLTSDPEPFDRYFGDAQNGAGHSAFLVAQMRRYVRVAALEGEMSGAKVLSAYCALRLGEYIQARDLADQLDAIVARDPDVAEVLVPFAAGIRAAAK